MFFTRKYKQMFGNLVSDIQAVNEDLDIFKQKIESEIENIKQNFKDLIHLVEENNIAEERERENLYQQNFSTIKEETRSVKKEVREILEWIHTDQKRFITDTQMNLESMLSQLKTIQADKQVISVETDTQERPCQEGISEIKADVVSMKQTIADILKWADMLPQSIKADADEHFQEIIRCIEANQIIEKVPEKADINDSDKSYQQDISEIKAEMRFIREHIADMLKWTDMTQKEFKTIKETITDTKKDINNSITYAISRIRT